MTASDERDPAQPTAPEPAPDQAPAPDVPPGARPEPAPGPGPGPGLGPVPGTPPLPRHTRLSGLWVVLAGGAVVLILLLVFILQNSQHVEVHIYGAHWNAPLGVALLMAAALGVLLVVVPGTGRILQLRRAARRAHRRATELERVTTPAGDTRTP